jgi:hypothetical protein
VLLLWRLLSGKMAKGTNRTNSTTGDWQDLNAWNIYQSCDKLPYSVFKDCCVDKDYERLIIDGIYVPHETLQRAWLSLYSEYCSISDDETVRGQITEMSELAVLESKIYRTKLAVRELYANYNEAWVEMLKSLGYKYKFPSDNKKLLYDDLEVVLRRLKNLERDADAITKSLNDKNHDEAKITHADFDNQLVIMQEAFKFFIDATKITAQQYALYIKRLKEMARKNEQQDNG